MSERAQVTSWQLAPASQLPTFQFKRTRLDIEFLVQYGNKVTKTGSLPFHSVSSDTIALLSMPQSNIVPVFLLDV